MCRLGYGLGWAQGTIHSMGSRPSPRNHLFDGVQTPMGKGNFAGERAAHSKVYGRPVVSCAKTAELVEMPSGIWTRVGPRKHELSRGAHMHHLANTTEPSVCCGYAVCCQIRSTTCYYCYFLTPVLSSQGEKIMLCKGKCQAGMVTPALSQNCRGVERH